jgi:hypothetical protein
VYPNGWIVKHAPYWRAIRIRIPTARVIENIGADVVTFQLQRPDKKTGGYL